jgi:hypothetical protein
MEAPAQDKTPAGINLLDAYIKIRNWYQANIDLLKDRTDDSSKRSRELILHLPDPNSAKEEEMLAVMAEVIAGGLEWAYGQSDGQFKMAAYAHEAAKPFGGYQLSEENQKFLKSSPLWPYTSWARTENTRPGVQGVEPSPEVSSVPPKEFLDPDVDRATPGYPTKVKAQLPGFAADDPAKDDLLGIKGDVRALCSVLAARDLQPPLSVGLFGDWGSGKSSFMEQMQERIDRLQEDARKHPNDSDYCENVVQLRFNAWHYIDTNLWANLTSTIFEGLDAALAKARGKDSNESVRTRALATAATAREALDEAERKRSQAEAELEQSEKRLKNLGNSVAEIEARLTPQELLMQASRFAVAQPEVRDSVAKAADALHIPKAEAAAMKVTNELLELRWTLGAILLAIRKTKRSWIWLLLGAASAVASWLAVPKLISLATQYRIPSYVDKLIAAVVALASSLGPLLPRARRALRFVEQARESKLALIKQKTAEKENELRAEEQDLKDRAEQAKREVDQARKAVKDFDAQLQALRADHQMADYIMQRRGSTDYTQHLGVIARARNDFMHLATLLGAVRREAEDDLRKRAEQTEKKRKDEGKPPLLPRIERIILYIDDLDRCPEKCVVDVLQAVHLLLAFPLFVVVVGVDSRWLLHSLRQHSKAFEQELEVADISHEERLHWEATPLNYLEKIFQIPFTLRLMTPQGFGKLVDNIFKHTGEASTAKAISEELPKTERAAFPDLTEQSSSQFPSSPTPSRSDEAPFDEEINRHPGYLGIEEEERKFIKRLFTLIPSPRAGKRLINIYRLLRASAEEDNGHHFQADEAYRQYQPALILLAILIGYPAQATVMLRELIEQKPISKPWWQFVDSLKNRANEDWPPAEKLGAADNGEREATAKSSRNKQGLSTATNGQVRLGEADAERWRELLQKLDALRKPQEVPPVISDGQSCEDFVKWAPRVARYSFQSGRILASHRFSETDR